MPSAAPISAGEFAGFVDVVSRDGVVNDRFIATRRGVVSGT